MYSNEKRKRFINLRGRGLSYRKIAEKLNLSTNTLVRWSRILAVHINNAQVIEFETIKEEYLVTRQHRAKVLATQLNNISQELIESDFSKVPPHRLMEMQTHISKELQAVSPKMQFNRKIPFGGREDIDKILNCTDSWQV